MDELRDGTATFRIIGDWVGDLPLSHAAFYLYYILKRYARDKDECFPSRATLAERVRVSERHITTLIRELEEAGAITVQTRLDPSGRTSSNLYTLPLTREGEPQFNPEPQFQGRVNCSSRGGGTVVPTKEKTIKEKTIKEPKPPANTTKSKDDQVEADAFVQAVKDAYPKGCRNPDWSNFRKRTRTDLKSKSSREKYLSAVRGYASTEPNHGYVKQPCSLIALVEDYVPLDPANSPKAPAQVFEYEEGWGGDL